MRAELVTIGTMTIYFMVEATAILDTASKQEDVEHLEEETEMLGSVAEIISLLQTEKQIRF
jgi:hypothetical protein